MSDNTNNPKRRNRYFKSGLSLMYNGYKYPAAETSILNDDGTTTKRNVGVDANNNYFYVENGQPHIVESLYPMDEVTVTSKMPTSVKAANQQKQAYMRAAGYNVPQDGSWNEEQQAIWDNLTIKPKEYDTTLIGLGKGLWDKYSGNTTERTNPLNQGVAKAYNPDEVDWDKTRKSQSKVVNALAETWGPLVAAANLPSLGSALMSAPIATMASIAGGAVGGSAVNKASEALTGRDFGTNVAMHTPLTPLLGEALNPGYTVGGMAGGIYGDFVSNNLANKERYTLNYLSPASYKGHWLDFPLTISAPLWRKPPTFFNGRKPAWYASMANKEGVRAAEQRYQNGLVWANIPEEEAAHPMFVQNADGSYRLTPEGFSPDLRSPSGAALVPDESKTDLDYFTIGRVGGEHSDYHELGDWMGAKLMQFKDEQKLNPQWLITHPTKKLVEKITGNQESKAWKFLDRLGGKSISEWMGYKPFTIKQNYIHTGNKVYPLYEDPSNTSNVPNFIISRH